MASIKIVLLKSKLNISGESPVVIQINHRYKTKRITLFSVDPRMFHNGKISTRHKDHARLNNVINQTTSEYQARIDALDQEGNPYYVNDILRERETSSGSLLYDVVMVYHVQQASVQKMSSARVMKNIADAIKEYDPTVRVYDVDKRWMDGFVNMLRSRESITSDNTVGKYVKNLRTVLRSDLTDYSNKAVMNYRLPRSETFIESLTMEEMKLWQSGPIPDHLHMYRDFFTFSVHCQGQRVSDVLTLEPSQIRNDMIYFRELKTGSRKGMGKVKVVGITRTMEQIIERYRNDSPHYVFPMLTQRPSDPKTDQKYRKHIASKTTLLNRNLKLVAAHLGINKRMTTHVARHTFASMADHENIDIRDIQRMLNHSKLEQTIGYIQRIREHETLNREAAKVLRRLDEIDQ